MSQEGIYSRANVTHFVFFIYRGGKTKLQILMNQFLLCLVKNIEIQES